MVELEHARALLEQMGLKTAAQLLDAQLERALHEQETYVQFLNGLLSSEQAGAPKEEQGDPTEAGQAPSQKRVG